MTLSGASGLIESRNSCLAAEEVLRNEAGSDRWTTINAGDAGELVPLEADEQINTLESANLNAETITAMRKGADALKGIHKQLWVILRDVAYSAGRSIKSTLSWTIFANRWILRTRYQRLSRTPLPQEPRSTRTSCLKSLLLWSRRNWTTASSGLTMCQYTPQLFHSELVKHRYPRLWRMMMMRSFVGFKPSLRASWACQVVH